MAVREQSAVVALTDSRWFFHFRPTDALRRVDEVNFWRPRAQSRFNALSPGQPFFFRLKHPVNAIAGFGFFALQTFLSVATAWEYFGTKNGDPERELFFGRIAEYRNLNQANRHHLSSQPLNCLLLREAVFLPERDWIPWREERGFARNIVAYRTYDLGDSHGAVLMNLLQRTPVAPVPELGPEFVPLLAGQRDVRHVAEERAVYDTGIREGQGVFRARLLSAYQQRCAVTTERALPVLDAAHIQPYLGPASNHIQNGIVLRADLHRLYDSGYVTINPDLRLEVSSRLRDEFENGKLYYALEGRQILVPNDPAQRPSRLALEWHAQNVFR